MTIWFEEITHNNPNLPKNIGGKFTGTLVNKSSDLDLVINQYFPDSFADRFVFVFSSVPYLAEDKSLREHF